MKQKVQNLFRQIDIVNQDTNIGVTRRVTGNLDLNVTPSSKVEVYIEEYWYIMDEEQKLVIPARNRLVSSKRILLEQGKTVASAMTNEDGSFVIEWQDPPIGHERPWRTDVYLVNETYQPSGNLPPLTNFPKKTAYRIFTLRWFDEIVTSEEDRPHRRFPTPVPTIMFYGDEKEKDVGQLFSEVT